MHIVNDIEWSSKVTGTKEEIVSWLDQVGADLENLNFNAKCGLRDTDLCQASIRIVGWKSVD